MKALNSLVSRALFGLGAVISFLWPLALGAHSATATTAARVPEITNKSTGNGSTTIHIGLQPGVETDGIRIVFNGKNVAERFEGSSCGKGTCEDATLSAVDGLRDEKNVLSVIAKGGVSGRLRFDNRTTGTPPRLRLSRRACFHLRIRPRPPSRTCRRPFWSQQSPCAPPTPAAGVERSMRRIPGLRSGISTSRMCSRLTVAQRDRRRGATL